MGGCAAQQGFFPIERTCRLPGRRPESSRSRAAAAPARAACQEKPLAVNIRRASRTAPAHASAGRARSACGRGGRRSLYLLSLVPHRLFQRDGANIHCKVPIPMATAALGAPSSASIDAGAPRCGAGGDPDRPTVPLRNRACRCCARPARRHVCPRRDRDADELTKPAANSSRSSTARRAGQDQPRERRLLQPGEGILRGFAELAGSCQLSALKSPSPHRATAFTHLLKLLPP